MNSGWMKFAYHKCLHYVTHRNGQHSFTACKRAFTHQLVRRPKVILRCKTCESSRLVKSIDRGDRKI